MKIMFPIPRITESFVDSVAHDLGWQRYLDLHTPLEGRLNADYLAEGTIIELKILEEEGLEKAERQTRLAKLLSVSKSNRSEVDITFENIAASVKQEVQKIISMPIQTAVKKASKQIRDSGEDLGREKDIGVLLIVNNGYSYLNADNFERLVVQRCRNDSNRINYAFCVTVDYHQGDFDAYIFCTARGHAIREVDSWNVETALADRFQARFNDAMTQMMQDQMNPKLWKNQLAPVTDIRFESDGVHYVRKAPDVPDSRVNRV
jgi:hypothetical protein